MTTRTVNKFRRMLEARRGELLWEIQKHRRPLAISANGDPVDRARTFAEREAAVRDLNRDTELLRKVTGALREIEEGTFGRCAKCDREIPPKRLRAVPWSPYCVACQEAAEVRESRQWESEAGDAAGYPLAS
jgi:RNA polymerase-binding transcription factor